MPTICWHELFMLLLVRKWRHSLFRCVNRPRWVGWLVRLLLTLSDFQVLESLNGYRPSADHAAWYIFRKLWPTAFRPRFPKCILQNVFLQSVFCEVYPSYATKLCELIVFSLSLAQHSPRKLYNSYPSQQDSFSLDYFDKLERIHVPDIFIWSLCTQQLQHFRTIICRLNWQKKATMPIKLLSSLTFTLPCTLGVDVLQKCKKTKLVTSIPMWNWILFV